MPFTDPVRFPFGLAAQTAESAARRLPAPSAAPRPTAVPASAPRPLAGMIAWRATTLPPERRASGAPTERYVHASTAPCPRSCRCHPRGAALPTSQPCCVRYRQTCIDVHRMVLLALPLPSFIASAAVSPERPLHRRMPRRRGTSRRRLGRPRVPVIQLPAPSRHQQAPRWTLAMQADPRMGNSCTAPYAVKSVLSLPRFAPIYFPAGRQRLASPSPAFLSALYTLQRLSRADPPTHHTSSPRLDVEP